MFALVLGFGIVKSKGWEYDTQVRDKQHIEQTYCIDVVEWGSKGWVQENAAIQHKPSIQP